MNREKIFQERLRLLRTEKGVSQKQVAEKLGITEVGYQNYEVGRRKPNFDIIPSIADFFNVSLDYLFGRSDNPARSQKGWCRLKATLPELDEITKRVIAGDKNAIESAEWFYKRLLNLINAFKEKLPDNMQVKVQFESSAKSFRVENIGFWEPDLIVFDVMLDDNSHTQIIMHKSQVRLSLKAEKISDPKTAKYRPVGFLRLPKT